MSDVSESARWLVACDLDQTLIYSRRACRFDGGPEPSLQVVETYQGAPASFVTARAAELIAELARRTELVAVTTRTLAQYARVDLGVRCRYAIVANGGQLLVDGRPDPDWEAVVRRRLAAGGLPVEEILARAEALADPSWVRTMRVADGLFVYLVAAERSMIPDLAPFAAELAAAGWTLSVQGRKVYLVPAALTKQAALAEVASRTGLTRLAAAGDSLLDAGMLEAADAGVRPAHGELHDAGWHRTHVRSTVSSGVTGGEELLECLLAVAGVTTTAG